MDDAVQAANMIRKGWQQFAENNLKGAEECFSEALSGLGDLLAQALFALGKIAYSRSEFDKALDYLARAVKSDPCFPDAYCLTAEIYFELKETKKAKEWCKKTLNVNWNFIQAHQILAQISLPGPGYHENIEMIHKWIQPRTYLEIGVASGDTLKYAADDTIAIGVDPSPSVNQPLGRLTKVFEKTSDDFFKSVDLRKEFSGNPVELAFIDGMHLFEFALRDFINIEKNCAANSVILVHDCYPLDDITASRERITDFWSGDVWKLIICLRKYRPDLSINVVGTFPTGLAIITHLNPKSQVLEDKLGDLYEEFVDMDYKCLNKDKEGKLNLVANEQSVIEGILKKNV